MGFYIDPFHFARFFFLKHEHTVLIYVSETLLRELNNSRQKGQDTSLQTSESDRNQWKCWCCFCLSFGSPEV